MKTLEKILKAIGLCMGICCLIYAICEKSFPLIVFLLICSFIVYMCKRRNLL